ncbi:hypothetical protein C488_16502 [Natrinema pellirubrum DSM 15624]|uniref:Uncharacterized protein n=1 Tax=Natrinema pellirubrum (strain DSM 15624 / CIP 106293 / JCM 10476 / NCIMB 786 / 157) TaxID=797303 RepID=L0JS26_NATP1|nr:hypothetical protein [Natrinema pellirubrum]AGB33186.1 hypothetical protein Natpe_3400 [Natrinema pellirubrum DSM 15624]ELY71851.1 hypothetical protein C488_16502 [Natrinema pellirubrum DSM 15624]
MADARLDGLFDDTQGNAVLAWALTIALVALAINHGFADSYRWFAFTAFAVAIVLLPVVAFRDPLVMPPWELLVLVLLPVVDATVLGESPLTSIAVYVAVAAVALVVTVEIDRFTAVRMNHAFAVALVVLTTLAVAGAWNVAQWLADVTFGTEYILNGRSQDAANRALMIDFGYAAVAGLFAGVLFGRYFGSDGDEGVETRRTPTPRDTSPDEEPDPVPTLIRDQLDVPDGIVVRLSRGMQAALAILLVYGVVSRDLTTVSNAAIALAITFLPALLERDAKLPLEPGLVFWLTAAVFLHVLGSAGMYALVGQWDSMTHTVSASIVAAGGYAVVRAIDLHTDEIYVPPAMLFTFILVFVLAFGVVWELMEFGIDWSAQRLGLEAVLAQHGLSDTIVDLVYDTVGAVVAAVWGSFYLTDLSERIAGRLAAS